MNNYTLYFTESNTRAATKQSHRHRKNKTPGEGISILAQHECEHRKYYKAVHHMLRVPADTTMRKNVTLQNTMKAMGGDQGLHIHG